MIRSKKRRFMKKKRRLWKADVTVLLPARRRRHRQRILSKRRRLPYIRRQSVHKTVAEGLGFMVLPEFRYTQRAKSRRSVCVLILVLPNGAILFAKTLIESRLNCGGFGDYSINGFFGFQAVGVCLNETLWKHRTRHHFWRLWFKLLITNTYLKWKSGSRL